MTSTPTSNGLYIGRVYSLMGSAPLDVKRWSNFYDNIIGSNISLCDRSGVVKLPYNFKVYDKFKLPTDLDGFNKTYEQICAERTQELLKLQDKLQVPINIYYSGGIDSTLVVIEFMKALSPSEARDRLRIKMSPESLRENPNFYFDHIRPKLSFESSESFSSDFDRSCIIVGGEHNDQLFGTDIIAKFVKYRPFETVHLPYTRDIVVGYFIFRGMEEIHANYWFDVLDVLARSAPCEIKTVFQFFWWLNFAMKWQCVYFRMLLRADRELRDGINQDYVDSYFHHFFSTDDFQRWAMTNPHLKIKNTWQSYKFHAKDLIYDYTKDADYRDHKIKYPSLYKLFLQKDTPIGLTENYEYLYELDREKLYVPNNSFNRDLVA